MPRSLFSMDGNFDFPPANDPNTRLGSLTARFNSLRQTFQSEREDRNATWTAVAEDRQTSLTSSPHSVEPRARLRMSYFSESSPGLPLASRAGSASRDTVQRPSSTYISQRARRAMSSRRPPSDSLDPSLIRYARQQIVETNAELERVQSSLRDIQSDQGTVRRRLNKRRKTEHGSSNDPTVGFHGFSYGHFGQVVEGLLRMEIVSCDGGEFSRDPPRHTGERYRPENVLSDDERVYCTKSSSCNLLLRHVGESNFTIQSIFVRAPKDGYTAPIQQGLVFVGNDAQELLAGTRNYCIRYGSANDNTPLSNVVRNWEREQMMTLFESLNDDETWEPSALQPDTAPENDEATRELATYFGLTEPDDEDPGRSLEDDPDICEEFATAPTPPPYRAVSSSGEDEEFELRAPQEREPERRRALLHEPSGDSELDEDLLSRLRGRQDDDPSSAHYSRRILRRRATPGRVIQTRPSNGVPRVDECIKPLRRFFIRAYRNEAKITLDPPVSARFVLLKLFSPMTPDGGNIDIEYVGVKGFAGPRYFPAIQPR